MTWNVFISPQRSFSESRVRFVLLLFCLFCHCFWKCMKSTRDSEMIDITLKEEGHWNWTDNNQCQNRALADDIIAFTSKPSQPLQLYPLLIRGMHQRSFFTISPASLSSLTLTPVRWLRFAPRGPDVQPDRSQRPRVSSAAPWSLTERPSHSHSAAAFPPYLQGETQRTYQSSWDLFRVLDEQ